MALTRVRYVGLSDIRIMSKADLAAAGVGVDRGMRWDASNRKTLFVDDISEEMLDLLKREGTFQVDAVDDTGAVQEKDIVKGAALDDTGNRVTAQPHVNPDGDDNAAEPVKAKGKKA